jgi:hypothetical protein
MNDLPTGFDFDSRRVTNSAQSEIIRQRLYDYQVYPLAGVAQLTFFSTPVGQGITSALGAVVGTAKTLWDTNIQIGNTLPSGLSYLMESIEIYFKPGSSAAANTFLPAAVSAFAAAAAATVLPGVNDVNTFSEAGLFTLTILQKDYLTETPAGAFPPKAENSLDSAGFASTSATAGEVAAGYMKMAGRPYYMNPEITLQPAVNFSATLKYPAAVAMPSGFNGRVGVIFDGYFMRAAQ